MQLVPRLAHDPDALDLLSRLLSINPCTRISAKQALQHPWFTQDPNLQQAHPAAMLPRATGQSPTTGVAGLRVGWTGAGGMMGGQGQAAATAQAAMPVDTGVVEMAH